MITQQSQFKKDLANNKMIINRTFKAPLPLVWKAWTVSNLLDQWWAPKPWKAETKKMDFRSGGSWLYCMVGPDGTRHWARADYQKVEPLKQFVGTDSFCDENGTTDTSLPTMNWKVSFREAGDDTEVIVELTCASREDFQKIIEMGFQEGFAAAHTNLDELLATKKIA